MKTPTFRAPLRADTKYDEDLRVQLVTHFRELGLTIDQLASALGLVSFSDTAPTDPGAEGDFVKNTDRSVQGSAGSMYILDGWEYSGSAWEERRNLTGN